MTLRHRVEVVRWEAARSEAVRIRESVFVQEQGVPLELEMDGHDEASLHAIAWCDGQIGTEAVGTARLLTDGHIGRMAVLASHRRQGIGSALLHALMARARTLGHLTLVLNAQTYAVPFYARAGFRSRGGLFLEAGIEHVQMYRTLD